MTLSSMLNIDTQVAYNGIALFINIVVFVFMYNKAVKNRVDKDDLRESEVRQDDKIRAVHHRVDGIEKRLDTGITELQKDVKDILKLLNR